MKRIGPELVIAHIAMLSLLLEERFHPKTGLWEPFWTLAVFLALPLGGALVMERRLWPVVFGILGTALACFPAVIRFAAGLDKAFVTKRPELLVVPSLAAILIVVPAAWASLDREKWGLALGDWRWWAPRALGLCAALVPFVLASAFLFPSLLEHYPSKAGRGSTQAFVLMNAGRGLYFIAWEWYFRGFLLFGLGRRIGPTAAALLQAFPFFLMHRSKPEIEMLSSFSGSLLLCWFCWRAGSFWPGFVLHWVMNVTMEVVGLLA